MTDRPRDLDRILAAFLGDGPIEAPDRTIDAALDEIAVAPQVRRLAAPWRYTMRNRVPVALAAAAAIVVLVAGAAYLGRNQPPVAASPSPGSSASTSPAASEPAGTVGPSPTAVAVSPNIGLGIRALTRVTAAITAVQRAGLLTADEAGRIQASADAARLSLGDGSVELALVGLQALQDRLAALESTLTGPTADELRLAVAAADIALNATRLGTGQLPAGPYFSSFFVKPRLAFSLPAGWSTYIDDPDVFALKHAKIVLAFHHTATAATTDAMARAIGHQGTADFTEGPTAVSYGTYEGYVGQAEPRNTLWYTAGLQAFDAAPGDVIRIWVLTVEGRVLTIEMTGPPADIAAVAPDVERMLSTFVAYQAPS